MTLARIPSPERLINRRVLIREEPRAILSNVQTVFQANSDLAINNNRRFVAKAHARLNGRFVAAHKVGPFVSVESNTVTGAMRQAGNLVVRPEAGVGDHFARCCIYRLAWNADFRRG